jgi:epoxyqueuosine reductase QueG
MQPSQSRPVRPGRRHQGLGRELGFADVRIADVDLAHAEPGLQAWLDAGRHGEMDYMAATA